MARCKSKTRLGSRCKNTAISGKKHCAVHAAKRDHERNIAIVVGAGMANFISPGIGSVIAGGILGNGISYLHSKRRSKVFVSFDYNNDLFLKEAIVRQALLPKSPFEIIDHSLQEAAPERTWEKTARKAISRCDIVIVMLGKKTHKAHGVLKEIKMAKDMDKQIVQIIGSSKYKCPRIKGAGRVYKWNWLKLTKILMP
jgi:hypothetical protein